jgi:hypothetical protein
MRITYVSGATVDTPRPLPADRIAFERKYQHRFGTGEVLEEYVLFMAWTQLHRVGLAAEDFDEWLPTVEDWGDEDAPEEPPDPTDAPLGQSIGSSPA